MLTCCISPHASTLPCPFDSPQARLLELVDRDICPFAMTELLSPQLPRAWRSYFEITFVFGTTSCDATGWVCQRRPRCPCHLHSVQALDGVSETPAL